MNRNSFGRVFAIFFITVVILCISGLFGKANKSSYLYSNKSYTSSSSAYKPTHSAAYSGSSYRSKSSGNSYRETSGSLSSGSYSSKPKSANKPTYNSYDSYDDGYDDVYMDGDYDYDRYDRDPDYADGVDDALDEFDGDW